MLNTWTIPRGISFREVIPSGDNDGTITDGAWLPLGTHDNWQVVLNYAASVQPPVITIQQADDASGTNPVALNITDITTISATDPDAAVESEVVDHKDTINRSTPSASFDSDGEGGEVNKKYRVIVRVDAQTLTTGKTHFRVRTVGTATARVVHAEAIGINKAYRGAV